VGGRNDVGGGGLGGRFLWGGKFTSIAGAPQI